MNSTSTRWLFNYFVSPGLEVGSVLPSGTAQPDVVIIGAGVIGTAIALELSRRGLRTVNVDRLGSAGHGSTSSSAGIIRTYASARDAVVLAAESMPYWQNWSGYLDLPAGTPAAQLRTCGSVVLDRTPDYLDAVVRTLSDAGVPYERWTDQQLADHLPYLDGRSFGPPRRIDDPLFWAEPAERLTGALHLFDSGYVTDPVLATQNLQHAAERLGATFRLGAAVVAVVQQSGRVTGVRLSDGTDLTAAIVVNAAGPHSAAINALAQVEDGMRVHTRALRQELHHVPCPPDLHYSTAGLHIADADLGINFRPETGSAILLGANGAACDEPWYVEDPDDFPASVTRLAWDTHTLRLARRIPSIGVPSHPAGVVGLYDVSDDWVPIYDRSDLDGFYMAIGTSGNQFKTAPMVGVLMAELIQACENGLDHDRRPLTLARPGGRDIHVGGYSRLREVDLMADASVNG